MVTKYYDICYNEPVAVWLFALLPVDENGKEKQNELLL